MKKISLLKTFALGTGLLLCAGSVSAKTIFVSATGAGDGTSEATPTVLNQPIIEAAEDGDQIVVIGTVTLGSQLDIADKTLSIIGYNAFDAANPGSASVLDGAGARIFSISGNSTVKITNLIFRNAVGGSSGGAISLDAGVSGILSAEIAYCRFENNTTETVGSSAENKGGAIFIAGASDVKLFGCQFDGNSAGRGGALFVDGATATVDYCDFDGNHTNYLDANARGGAVAAAGTYSATFNYCGFTSNYSLKGAGVFFIYGGGEFVVKNSYITGNRSGQIWLDEYDADPLAAHSAGANDQTNGSVAVIFEGDATFINTTISNNRGGGDCIGTILNSTAGVFSLINTTIADNYSYGNADHCAGVKIEGNGTVNIYNTIIDRNKADGGSWWSDFLAASGNIYVGNSILSAASSTPLINWEDSSNDPNSLSFVMGNGTVHFNEGEGSEIGDPNKNTAGLATINETHIPLLASSPAIAFGNPAYLANWEIDTDQLDNARNMSGKVYAGAVELLSTDNSERLYVIPESKPEAYYAYNEDGTGLFDVAADGSVAVGYYTILGQKLDKEPASGLFIVKYSNGTSVKVVK